MGATHQQKHQAGRHFAVGQALLRGWPAELVGPSSLIRINDRQAQVQVAAQGAWQIADVDKYLAAVIGYIVLVDVRSVDPAYYVATGDKVRELVSRRHEEFLARHGGVRPRTSGSRHAAIRLHDVQAWKDCWSVFG